MEPSCYIILRRTHLRAVGIKDDFIKLGQLLKLADMVSSGVEAKQVITDGQVLVNGEVEIRRGKKIYPQDVVKFNGEEITVIEE